MCVHVYICVCVLTYKFNHIGCSRGHITPDIIVSFDDQ